MSKEGLRGLLTEVVQTYERVHKDPQALQQAAAQRAIWERALQTTMDRRQFVELSVALAVLGLAEHLRAATAAAQSGRFAIQDIDYEPGHQSFSWLPAREGYGDLGEFDQAVENYSGSRLPEPTGPYLERFSKDLMKKTPGGTSWVGDCEPASLAAGDCPYIEGDKEALGVTMPWWERMVLATLHYRYTQLIDSWQGPLTADQYGQIQDRFAAIQDSGQRLLFVVNTSDYRGFPGQQWWGLLDGFEGDRMRIIDFLEWGDLQAGEPKQKFFGPVPYNRITRVKLKDPNQPEPGQEAGFKYTVNRPVAKVFLGKAAAIPR